VNLKFKRKLLLSLLVLDAASVILAFFSAYYLRNTGPFRLFLEAVQPLNIYLTVLPVAILLLIILFHLSGLYDQTKRTKPLTESYLLIKTVSLWILIIMASSYLYKYDYSRIIVALFYIFTLTYVLIIRSFIRKFETDLYKKGVGVINILIVGAGRNGREIARRLEELEAAGYKLIGFLDDEVKSKKNFPVIGHLSDISKIISKRKVNEVYIADPRLSHETILELITKCEGKNVKFKVVSNVFDLVSGAVDISRLESVPSLDLWRVKAGWGSGVGKRTFDVITSIVFIIPSFPIWVTIVVSIYLTDGAPALLAQDRVGFKGKKFKMIKFRTMKKGAAKYADSPKNLQDKRITTVGKFLRKTSLDELPQLINVFLGEMSMVGPRPEMPQKVAKYTPWQKKRLEAKPGLTGLWQILGRKDLPLEHNLEYDFYYINNQSFLLDLIIILKTIPLVLSGKGAY
jgi:exopolysaccharide biosynthesis polyprenyl glycosylphosphotransferase